MARDFALILPKVSGVATYPPGATFGPRQMKEYEFVWIIEGECRYQVDGEAFAAPPGSIVLCRPETVDKFDWDARRRTRHAYFHFGIRSAPVAWQPDVCPVVVGGDDDVLIPLFRYVLAWAGRGDPEMLQRVIGTMLRAMNVDQRKLAEPLPMVAPDPVQRALNFLYETLASDAAAELSLDAIASAACVTGAHLCRLFQKTHGRSPMECVRLARLDRAAELLSRSNFSIGQIATMCGFASQFHFARRFKDAFGHAPSTIRKDVRAGQTPPLPRLLTQGGFGQRDQNRA